MDLNTLSLKELKDLQDKVAIAIFDVTPKHPSGYRVLGCTFDVRAER
jgi:hypothetical protein